MTIQFRVIGLVPRLPTGTTAAVRGRFALPLNSSSRGFITLVSSSPTTSSILGRPSNKSQGCVLQIQGRSSNLGLRTAGRATLVSKSFFHSTTSSPPKPTPVIELAESPAVRQGTTPPPGGKAVFPATLLIYHAGTAKTSFLAVLKLTTIFVFGFFCLIMTPIYLTAGKDYSYAALVFSCGTIPFLYVAWATSPFVAAIHMHLPPYARWSPAILQRFIRTAPPNTRIDIATMSLIGKPRVSSMTIGDLKPCKKRFGMVNYERDTKLLDKERSWWRFRAVRYFNVQQGNDEKIKTGWVWRELAERIEGEEEKNKGVKRSVAAGAGSGSVSGVGTKVTGKK